MTKASQTFSRSRRVGTQTNSASRRLSRLSTATMSAKDGSRLRRFQEYCGTRQNRTPNRRES